MANKPESINGARFPLPARKRREVKKAATRARRHAEQRDPEDAPTRVIRGYAD